MSEVPSQEIEIREPWTEQEVQQLVQLWPVEPVIMIAIKLKRSMSSVTTRASRSGLPNRKHDQSRHRKRWSTVEDTILDQMVFQKSNLDALQAYANESGRTLDAVANRIVARHGQAGLEVILQTSLETSAVETLMRRTEPNLQIRDPNMRKCMTPTCRADFITPDRRRVWHCPQCRTRMGYNN